MNKFDAFAMILGEIVIVLAVIAIGVYVIYLFGLAILWIIKGRAKLKELKEYRAEDRKLIDSLMATNQFQNEKLKRLEEAEYRDDPATRVVNDLLSASVERRSE